MRKRMKTVRGLWAGLLAAAVVLTSAAPSALTVQAEEADAVQTAEVSGVEYQIYPTPHEMTYQDGGFDIGEVNIVYENGVDDGQTKIYLLCNAPSHIYLHIRRSRRYLQGYSSCRQLLHW